MPLNIEGEVSFTLVVDDQDNVDGAYGSTVILTEGYGNLIPSGRVIIEDRAGNVRFGITQGNKIAVSLMDSVDVEKTTTYYYRVFEVNRTYGTDRVWVTLDLVLDAPEFMTKSRIKAYKGTSEQVVREILRGNDLYYDSIGVESTNDSQTWLNIGKSDSNFLREVVKHGYKDKSSALWSALTADRLFKYVDLFDLLTKDPKFHFMNLSVPAVKAPPIVYHSMKRTSVSDILNSSHNYGYSNYYHRLKDWVKKIEDATFKFEGKYATINKDIKEVIEFSRKEYVDVVDCGNTHPFYNEAAAQNLRGLFLFGERLTVITDRSIGCEVLDTIWLSYVVDQNSNVDMSLEGKYLIISKTKYMEFGQRYVEKYLLSRPSHNIQGSTNLVS